MAPLPQITLDFNRRIKLSNDGGALSSKEAEAVPVESEHPGAEITCQYHA
ncbi:hypothetical protein GCM10011391_34070 [Pullulanibacillus camelliae]|uniref:Uncharacterized protein n=1 Tax=Pullulanibacillus camelliae TaxID=1707096 RepID=A0A8J3DZU9_9BACL|nr:hypothetical protein GCM10011391_34070 [Pullulanibacillus camelliae]